MGFAQFLVLFQEICVIKFLCCKQYPYHATADLQQEQKWEFSKKLGLDAPSEWIVPTQATCHMDMAAPDEGAECRGTCGRDPPFLFWWENLVSLVAMTKWEHKGTRCSQCDKAVGDTAVKSLRKGLYCQNEQLLTNNLM